MRNLINGSLVLLVLTLFGWLIWENRAVPATQNIAVYFSPKGGCAEACVREINTAKKTLWIQAYSFTNKEIAKAVVDAKNRGVQVIVILDKSNEKETYSAGTFLINEGVEVWIDAKHAIAHNKIMVIDGLVIITGSFNFTTQAENSNAENMLVLKGYPDLVKLYQDNFQHHLGHSEKYISKK
jgi:phosphatidylserine/phosphatidylglycerophosphate/cardiolipin synthase-like enzyme